MIGIGGTEYRYAGPTKWNKSKFRMPSYTQEVKNTDGHAARNMLRMREHFVGYVAQRSTSTGDKASSDSETNAEGSSATNKHSDSPPGSDDILKQGSKGEVQQRVANAIENIVESIGTTSTTTLDIFQSQVYLSGQRKDLFLERAAKKRGMHI